MNEITNYTEEIIHSFLSFSNKIIDPHDYLLFRQQAINEVTNPQLKCFTEPCKKDKNDKNINHTQTISSETITEKQQSISKNVAKQTTEKPKTILSSDESTVEQDMIEDTNASNFWDVINRIED